MYKKLLLILPKLFFVILLFALASQSYGQLVPPGQEEIPVTIKVINQKKEPIAFATITVINRLDSLQSIKKVADSIGVARFNLTKGGQYMVKITSINYQPVEKGIAVTGNQNFFNFTAEPLPKTLGNVVVTSQKPLMRQEDDKTIVDPESLAAASTNAYEILEKTPGLFVDQDGNIYINSLTPATVQINGRDMKMSASDVATMLKNLPPNSIAKIEIVRTPSAKYDASGSGGVVNVVLKKGVKLGITGSVNAGMQQGVYGNQFIGFNLNNNTGKKTSYINFNLGKRNNYERINTNRLFAVDSMLSQDAYTKYPTNSIYTSFGITWEFGKKWEVTYDGDINYNKYKNRSENRNSIKKISTAQLISNSLNSVSNDGYNLSMGSGLESKYKIDTLGSEWTNDTYFTHSKNNADQVYATNSLTSPGLVLASGDGSADNDRNYFTGRSDLKLKMKMKFTLETGIQSTIQTNNSVANYFSESNGIRTKDISRTNTFRYNQNINSFYLQGAKTIGKDFIAKFGTRLENTNMKGRQIIPGDTSFSIHRTDLFPYIYLSKKIMRIAGFDLRAYLVYRRSIRRPSYDQLNPFRRYVDELLTETGNPALRPQFTKNYEFNISVNETPLLALGINDTKDIFTNLVKPDIDPQVPGSSKALRTYDNLGKNKEWYFRAMGALPPGKKYFFVLGAQYNHNFYQGLYEFKRGTWTFFTYHTLKLGTRSTWTMNGFVRLKGQQGFYELSSFGALNSSINRKFLKDKFTVTLSMNDIFGTNKNEFIYKQGLIDASGYRQGDTRRFGINIRYNFGIRKKEENNTPDMESPEKTN
jgi:hypothetical protein